MNTEKHCATKVTVRIDDMRSLWSDTSDNVRMEILKSVIWTSQDNHGFYEKAMKVLNSEQFRETLD
jgi:hypothetical protein